MLDSYKKGAEKLFANELCHKLISYFSYLDFTLNIWKLVQVTMEKGDTKNKTEINQETKYKHNTHNMKLSMCKTREDSSLLYIKENADACHVANLTHSQ